MQWLSRRKFLTALSVFAAITANMTALVRVAAQERKLSVVATTGMIADIVRGVGGDRVEVRQLMGQGVDPHLYKATRSDIAAMLNADVVFYNGLLLEGKITDAFVRVATSGRPVFAVTELIAEDYLIEPKGLSGHYDPHVWMDPQAWSRAVLVVRHKLSDSDPAGAELFAEKSERYIAELQRLDAYSEKALNSVAPEGRILITAHDAFNYFGKRYGFEVLGVQGLSTESEAGLKQIEELVALIVERRIPAVFIESTIPERSVQALVAGANARGHHVEVGGLLYSDAMGAPSTYEGTYMGMIDHNVTTIARALGGATPQRGLNGQLAQAQ